MPIRQDLVNLINDINTALDTLNGTSPNDGVIPQLQELVEQEQQTVAFITPSSSMYKEDAPQQILVKLYTNGQPLTSDLSVSVQDAGGSAQPNVHYTFSPATVVFPSGSGDGTTKPVTVTPIASAITSNKIAALKLNPGKLGTIAKHEVTVKAVWCYTFDFTVDDGGWVNVTPNGRGVYVAGQGWRGTGGGQPTERIVIEKTFSTIKITEIEATIYNDATGSNHNELWFNGTNRASNNNTGSQILTWNGSENGSSVRLDLEGNANAVAYISQVVIRGENGNPFGAANCT